MMQTIPSSIMNQFVMMQRNEITEYYVYRQIAKRMKDKKNQTILNQIAEDERAHSLFWERITQKTVQPNRWKIFRYTVLATLFGYTFALKLMEQGEDKTQGTYADFTAYVPEAKQLSDDEEAHEKQLLGMLDEERLNHIGSMVLGLNDALVELTGTIAGLTFAFADSKLISLSALITGIAASLSMASSEYLSIKSENGPQALKSSLYTGVAYVITVALLILPFLLIPNQHYLSLGIMVGVVILIIFGFNYYISVAKDYPFKQRFLQMVSISLGVALISFLIGMVVKSVWGLDI
jgi:VIT1/CCC1 family predicted Fe2+/Mn2+ transporter